MVKTDTFALTISGRRKNNQDSCLAFKDKRLTLLAVADGMGGTLGGEIASKEVIDVAKNVLAEIDQEKFNPKQLKNVIQKIYADSHERLVEIIAEKPELAGMGTTLSCVLLFDNNYVWGNIGDSRIYFFNGTGFLQITTDHSLIEEYRKEYGDDIPEYIKVRSNIITRSLGGDNDEPDIFPQDKDFEILKPGEGFLICSDGLILEKVSKDAMWMENYLLGTKNLKQAAENLICHAFYSGSTDNISVVLFENGRFKRKRTNIKKYKFPPVDKPAKPVRQKRNIFLKRLVSLLVLIIAGLAIYWIYTGKAKRADSEQLPPDITHKTPPPESEAENQPVKDWNPWEGHFSTPRSINENITWQPYISGKRIRYEITFTANSDETKPIQLDKSEIRPADHQIGPGVYSVELKVILRGADPITAPIKKIKLN